MNKHFKRISRLEMYFLKDTLGPEEEGGGGGGFTHLLLGVGFD